MIVINEPLRCHAQCFSAGAEIGQHKNDHPYQFMVSLSRKAIEYFFIVQSYDK